MMFPEKIKLGRREVSRLGFGCWQLGGHGWQDLDAKNLEKAVRDALESGVTLFDTADVYGLGHSEETLGRLLKDRDDVCIATKFGVRFVDGKRMHDVSPDYMREALEASRKRLNRDCIDLYQMHWPDDKTELRHVFDALENARHKKHIVAYGISNISLRDWKKKDLPEGLVSFSFEYSLINHEREDDIRFMQNELGLVFISWGSLAQGLLSGKYARGHKFADGDVRARPESLFADKNWDRYEPILNALKSAASRQNQSRKQSMSRIALRWILDGMGGITLAGIKTPQQLADNVKAFGWKLPDNIIEELNKVSHG